MYGITETTVHVTYRPISAADLVNSSGSRIGRQIPDLDLFVLDQNLAPCATGVSGELFVGGAGLATGYLRQPELTASRFIPHPWKAGSRLYRSGDLARRTADGDIEYLGRCDTQVKIRGFRIELGEIESAVLQHPAVKQAAIVPHAVASGENQLIAYVVRTDGAMLNERDLRAFIRQRLPSYMIPSSLIWLDALPMNHNGKLDTKALPAIDATEPSTAPAEAVAPRNEVEKGVAQVWGRVLARNSISVLDDFFTVGGHSLLALRMLGDIRSRFGIDVPPQRLFETPTVEGLAQFISERMPAVPAPASASLLQIQRGEASRQPLFLVPGGWGGEIEFLVYGELSRQMDPSIPIWGLKARGAGTSDAPHASVTEMAADYLREIRRIQPQGPYLLAGECLGGICAHEMACQLEQAGESVALLVLLDTSVPTENQLNEYLDAETRKRDAEDHQITLHQRVRHHLDRMSGLSLGGKVGYVFNKTARRGKTEPVCDGTSAEQHPRGQKDYPVTLLRHKLRPYNGTVTLLIDEESSRLYGKFGWEKMAVARLDTHILPGTHLTYIRENAASAAAKLRELLRPAPSHLHHDPATA
jgi:thioesterase domain-containing protein/acyl carrier protein